MIKKSLYKTPFAELVWAESEESFMSPNEYFDGGAGTYDPGDINDNGDF